MVSGRVSGFPAGPACVCLLAAEECTFFCATEGRKFAFVVKFASPVTAMPDYAWICFSCKQPNNSGTQSCRACGFPSEASGSEIEEAAAKTVRPPRQSRKAFLQARRMELAALPLWKKPFAYCLRGLQLVGGVTVWGGVFDLSLWLVVLGLLIAVGAELLFQLLKGKPYAWETNVRSGG